MKGKTLSAIITVLLALSIFAVLPVRGSPTATMYFDPGTFTGKDIDDTFDTSVMIKDFTDLYTWQVEVTWNPAVLDLISYVAPTTLTDDVFDILAPGVFTSFIPGTINHAAGIFTYSAYSLSGESGVTGTPGTGYKMMTLHFKVRGYGSSAIHFNQPYPAYSPPNDHTYWLQSVGSEQPCEYIDGTVETVPAPAPYGPTAKFTWTPTVPIIGTEVTFDASTSKSGFDGSHTCPITEYRWDFDGDLVWDKSVSTATTTWTFAIAGDYSVTLEVYAPGATPETDRLTKTVKVIPPPMGAAVDLTAPSQAPWDGEGPNVECDAFAPQQEVLLRAKVTYNLDPVEGKLVAFEVHDSRDNIIITRTATTNADGIAEVTFRIPSMPNFGDWLAIVTVDVAETTVADTMPFKVGWIIEILSVEPEATTYHKGAQMYFTLTFKNIALSTKTTTLTVVVYDDVGVPIGLLVVPDWSVEGGFEGPYMTTGILVPSWAFIGTGKVYANAYTVLPSLGGVPYCPEASAEFLLEH